MRNRLRTARAERSNARAVRRPGDRRPSRRVARALVWIALVLGAAVMFFPFVWMISTACKPTDELLDYGLALFPSEWVCIDNVRELFDSTPLFGRFMLNTAIVTVVRTVGQFFLTTLAAYGFARYEFPFKRTLFLAALAILMVPGQALVIPQFALIREMGLFGTVAGIALPNVASAFSLFLFRQAFLQIPIEYEEAASIEGAGPLRILYFITVPMAKAATAAFVIISILASWNDFFWPLVIANNNDARVVTVAISLINSRNLFPDAPFNITMVAALLSIIPVLIAFIALQRYFVEGLSGGVKG